MHVVAAVVSILLLHGVLAYDIAIITNTSAAVSVTKNRSGVGWVQGICMQRATAGGPHRGRMCVVGVVEGSMRKLLLLLVQLLLMFVQKW